MTDKWQIQHSAYVLQTPFINVRKDACKLPDGSVIPDYYVVEEPDFGWVFALTEDEQVVMVQQYKHGIGKVLLELPAGYYTPEEDPTVGALREFHEETGYAVREYTYAGRFVRHPSRTTNYGHLVIATGAHKSGAQHLDPAESIAVVLLPFEEVFQHIYRQEIDAVGTVACIFYAHGWLKQQGKLRD